MIIAEIELRQPHHYAGQLRHAYRQRDGFDIRVEGIMIYVVNRATGHGVMFPATDVITGRTEPGQPLPLPADVVMTSDDEITEPAPTGHPGHRVPKPVRKP